MQESLDLNVARIPAIPVEIPDAICPVQACWKLMQQAFFCGSQIRKVIDIKRTEILGLQAVLTKPSKPSAWESDSSNSAKNSPCSLLGSDHLLQMTPSSAGLPRQTNSRGLPPQRGGPRFSVARHRISSWDHSFISSIHTITNFYRTVIFNSCPSTCVRCIKGPY